MEKIENAVQLGRINHPNEKRPGITEVTAHEQKAGQFRTRYKLRILGDLRVAIRDRDPTEQEIKLLDEVKMVLSPAAYRLHSPR
jgi:hypothetical protein